MSFITPYLTRAVSFVADPYFTCRDYLNSSLAANKKERDADFAKQLATVKKNPIDPVVATKIQAFLKEKGFDPSKIMLFESDGPKAYGSLKYGTFAAIGLDESILEEIKTEFKAKHKFRILHELGHLVQDNVFLEEINELNLMKMGAFAAASVAFSVLFGGFVVPHLVACGVSKYIEKPVEKKQLHAREFAADRFAAVTGGLEIIEGGVEDLRQARLLRYQEALKTLPMYRQHMKEYDAMPKKYRSANSAEGRQKIAELKEMTLSEIAKETSAIKSKGDDSGSVTHPPISKRIAALQQIAAMLKKTR